MFRLPHWSPLGAAALFCALHLAPAHAAVSSAAPVLAIEGLGKGTAALDGPWQFRVGDDLSWAKPELDDSNWGQITADKTWGAQGHPAYTGYAWYRKHIRFAIAPNADPDLALFIQHVDDAYEIYWNGRRVGGYGALPPHATYFYDTGAQTFGLGPVREGVLAVRVWKAPLNSFDTDQLGGFSHAPLIGGPAAISDHKASQDYVWLQSRQYTFALASLRALIFALSLLAWFRNRSQKVLLAMAAATGAAIAALILVNLRLPLSFRTAMGILQPVLSVADIGLWYLLLYLLRLNERPRMARFTRNLAIVDICATVLDGSLVVLDWTNPHVTGWAQVTDALLTTVFTVAELYPLVLVGCAIGKRLTSDRWFLAIAAALAGMLSILRITVQQGSRYTHWTLGDRIAAPLFTIRGNIFTAQTLADTLLLISIIYAVYRSMRETTLRQSTLEQEFKSARELQRVLIPEALPTLPGFDLTSAYRPALEVGGDFFQIIPLEGANAGATLILLGDVSGKGLAAAMTVSLIVGAARAITRFVDSPGAVLSELNTRIYGRMRGGFATCLAVRIEPDGRCIFASAGHPSPYLNQRALGLDGALPLGILPLVGYEERTTMMREGDQCTLYTDGLLEARDAAGEIFSFERLDELFAKAPSATEATDAAVDFGQEDDITVVTLTKRALGYSGASRLVVSELRAS